RAATTCHDIPLFVTGRAFRDGFRDSRLGDVAHPHDIGTITGALISGGAAGPWIAGAIHPHRAATPLLSGVASRPPPRSGLLHLAGFALYPVEHRALNATCSRVSGNDYCADFVSS